MIRRILITTSILLGCMSLVARASTTDGTIDSVNRYAWAENVGWLDFGSTEGNVHVTDVSLTGYAWGENIGWISLNCSNTSSCGAVNYAVLNDGAGNLSGYAWGENVGWINFNPAGYGVSIDNNGDFSGYAWGENVGWISFNCTNTSSCGTVSYKVSTDYRPTLASTPTPTPTPPIIIGGGGTPTPTPISTATPTASPSPTVTPSAPPTATCFPRPACLDAFPACKPPEPVGGWCPTSTKPPGPSCLPRPACLDADPACLIPVPIGGWCPVITPPSSPPPPPGGPECKPRPACLDAVPACDISEPIEGWCPVTHIIIPPIVLPPIVALGGIIALGQVLSVAIPLMSTSADVVFYGMYVWQHFMEILGFWRRAPRRGIIYNALTKQPIPFAKIDLLDEAARVIETRIADEYGRYGFLISSSGGGILGEHRIVNLRVTKSGFHFPSQKIKGDTDGEVYPSVYAQHPYQYNIGDIVQLNVPLDPEHEPSFVPRKAASQVWGAIWVRTGSITFFASFIVAATEFILYRQVVYAISLGVFVIIAALRQLGLKPKPFGVTLDSAAAGMALPFSLVTLTDAQEGRAGFAVSDEYGRYFMPSHEGVYQLHAATPAQVQPPRNVARQVKPKGGFIREKIAL